MVNPDRNLYEPPYDDALLYDTDLEPERPRSRPLVVLLGIVVLAAFAGVVWVAYNQGVKQGQNGLPVLTADAGPTRIIPDPATASPAIDPAPAKSYDRLMTSEPESDQVNMLPKPEQPKTTPSPQDLAVAPGETGTGGKYGIKATDFDAPVGMDTTVGSITGAPGASEDITAALPPRDAAKPVQTALAPSKPISAKEIAPAPAPPVAAKPAPVEIAPAPAETIEAPASAQGGVMIQLGSFPNAALAASAWSKIMSSHQELLSDHSPSFNRAEIPGKGTWYRLRVGGFSDKAEAQTACQQLTTAGQACIIAAK
ncbi:MAG: SPOR domain-containing protein [Alphaproteobacteria bacterium]|nr:SPOR domain-containing protein [Alphaproteobacteria bacterium]